MVGQNLSQRGRVSRPVQGLGTLYLRSVSAPCCPQALVVAIAVPIRYEQQVLGALVYQYRLDGITAWLKQLQVGSSGYVFVIDHTGTVAAHPKLNLQDRQYDEYADVAPMQEALRGQPH